MIGSAAIDAGTVARIVKTRAADAGFDPRALGGHSLKRGALTSSGSGKSEAQSLGIPVSLAVKLRSNV